MKRLSVILAVLGLVAAACGAGNNVGSAGSVTTGPGAIGATTTSTSVPPTIPPSTTSLPPTSGPTTTTAPERFVDVYFIKDASHAVAVTRTVPGTPDVGANAIRALIEGPTAEDAGNGLSSAVPRDTLLLGLAIDGGIATVDLSREFEGGGGSFSMISRLAQLVYTLTEFPTVDAVRLHLDGEPVDYFSGEGILVEEPQRRSDFASFLPIGAVMVDSPERWSQAELPSTSGVAPSSLGRVVLVAADDVLNVRSAPGVDHPVIGMLPPGVVVVKTGSDAPVSTSTWVQISTPAGPGWINGFFLGAVVDAAAFGADRSVDALLDELMTIIAARGDLTPVTSRRGLYVSHHAAPVRFPLAELAAILTSTTTYQWPSNALDVNDPDQAAEIRARTFTEAIADRVLSTHDDPDLVTTVNEPITGGNGRLPEYAIPDRLAGFNYVGMYDSGDNPEYGGLDWTVWYASFDYEDGRPVIVGLTLDEWAP